MEFFDSTGTADAILKWLGIDNQYVRGLELRCFVDEAPTLRLTLLVPDSHGMLQTEELYRVELVEPGGTDANSSSS